MDPFEGMATGMTGPIVNNEAIVPDDATDLDTIPRTVWVGVGGNIRCTLMGSDTPQTYLNVPAGTWPRRVKRVYATDTTATDLIAEW